MKIYIFFFSGTFSLIQDTVNMTTVSHVYVDIKGAVVEATFLLHEKN